MNKIIAFLCACALVVSGCTTNAYTGESQTAKTVWGTGIGAAVGAGTGALVAKDSGKGALIGGLAGAAVGAGVGLYLDNAEKELRAELQSTGVQVSREGGDIRLIMPGNVTFTSNSSDINAGFYAPLNSVAKVLKKYSNSSVLVTGHTDSTGSDELNLTLSRNRASSVAAYLQGQGVAAKRFQVLGMGKSNPLMTNATAQGREQNRRVELKIIANQ